MHHSYLLVRDWLWLSRITVLFPIGLAFGCAASLCGIAFDLRSVCLAVSLLSLAAGGFMVNDAADVSKDRVNNPRRPVASGSVSPLAANYAGLVLTTASVALAAAAGDTLVTIQMAVGCVLVLSYTWVSARAAWLCNPITALLSVLPWTIPAATTGQWVVIFVPAATGFGLVLARELLLDVIDLEGDKSLGFATLPSIVGRKAAAVLSAGLMVATCAGVTTLVAVRGNPGSTFVSFWTLGVCLPGLAIAAVSMLRRDEPLPRMLSHLSKVQLIAAIAAWWSIAR